MADSPRAPGSPRASPRAGDKKRSTFFNQSPEEAFSVFDLVEILCDDEETGASSWLPARVTRTMGDSLEVLMLGERDSFEVRQTSRAPQSAGLDTYVNSQTRFNLILDLPRPSLSLDLSRCTRVSCVRSQSSTAKRCHPSTW